MYEGPFRYTNVTTGDEDGIMATATLGQVEPFELEGGDWNVYSERLDQFLVSNGVVDDAKKVAVFLTVIGGRAYALLRNLLAPTKPADKSYGELVKVMKNHLKPTPPVIAERFKFHRRTNETARRSPSILPSCESSRSSAILKNISRKP